LYGFVKITHNNNFNDKYKRLRRKNSNFALYNIHNSDTRICYSIIMNQMYDVIDINISVNCMLQTIENVAVASWFVQLPFFVMCAWKHSYVHCTSVHGRMENRSIGIGRGLSILLKSVIIIIILIKRCIIIVIIVASFFVHGKWSEPEQT